MMGIDQFTCCLATTSWYNQIIIAIFDIVFHKLVILTLAAKPVISIAIATDHDEPHSHFLTHFSVEISNDS